MKIIIIGLGLIGGSIAKSLSSSKNHEILAFDIDQSSIKNALDGSQELRGNKVDADEESTESYDEQNRNTENELAGSINKNNSGSNGKIPEDIPFDDNDDVLAQQIKNAALKERDPEKQKKIWNEYRKYKNLPLEDWVFIKFMI